ncbi:MAG: periplasmic heavy metal sensor [Chlorobium sp.]
MMKKTMMVITASLLFGFAGATAVTACPGAMGGGGQGGGRVHGCGAGMMEERLGLNDKQSEQVEELRANQYKKVSAERRKLAALERELQAESVKAKQDKKKIDQLSEKIGKQHAALARLQSNHMAEVSAILTPAQRDSMRTIMDGRPGLNNCIMKQR